MEMAIAVAWLATMTMTIGDADRAACRRAGSIMKLKHEMTLQGAVGGA